jgi:DNA-binding XRE family transcriptional regulator
MRTAHLMGWPDVRDVPVHIYALRDPRTAEVRYVGRSSNPLGRLASHRHSTGAPRVRDWYRSVERDGLAPELVILHTVPSGVDADPWEEHYIGEMLGLGHRLLNGRLTHSLASPRGGGVGNGDPENARRLGSRCRGARVAMGISQALLAARVGVRPHVLSWIENGRIAAIEAATAEKLATALDVSLDWLVMGRGSGPDHPSRTCTEG